MARIPLPEGVPGIAGPPMQQALGLWTVALIRERFGAASDESKVGTEAEALDTDLK